MHTTEPNRLLFLFLLGLPLNLVASPQIVTKNNHSNQETNHIEIYNHIEAGSTKKKLPLDLPHRFKNCTYLSYASKWESSKSIKEISLKDANCFELTGKKCIQPFQMVTRHSLINLCQESIEKLKAFVDNVVSQNNWEFILLTFLFIIIVVIYKLVKYLLAKLCNCLTRWLAYDKIDNFAGPLAVIILYLGSKLILPFLKLSDTVCHKVVVYGNLFLYSFLLFSTHEVIDLISAYIINQQTVGKKFHFNVMLLPIVKVSLKVLISILMVIKILQTLSFDIKGLLTGVGFGGLGFALASQDTIKNFFGSLVILTDKPFQIGDYIVAEKIDGKVEEIGFRSTRIRTHQGYLIYVPNANLANTYITNYGEKQYKGLATTLAIAQDTPIKVLEAFIGGLRKIIERCPIARAGKYKVYLYELKDSILYIKIDIDFNVTEEKTELSNRQDLLFQIIKLARILKVHFAFPTHTVQLLPAVSNNEQEIYIQDTEVQEEDLKKRLQTFFETNTPT